MPDWVPQVAPDLCSRCGAYWECELHGVAALIDGFANVEPLGAALTVEDMQAAVQRIKDMPAEYITTRTNWGWLDDKALLLAAEKLDAP